MRTSLGFAFVLIAVGTATAQPAPRDSSSPGLSPAAPEPHAAPPAVPAQPGSVSRPNWIARPDAGVIAYLYPDEASQRGVNGRTVMTCTVRADGTMGPCKIRDESPKGLGFGAAALRSAKYFKIAPKTMSGAPVDGATIDIPMTWRKF